jgi:hypothetical protein
LNNEITKDKRIKEWCCNLNKKKEIIWGKIKTKNNNTAIIQHYIGHNSSRMETMELVQCKGCNLNLKHNDPICLLKIDLKKTLGCDYLNRKTNINPNKITIPCNLYTMENTIIENLLTHVKKRKNKKDQCRISIDIENPEIDQINKSISSKEHLLEITTMYLENRNKERERTQKYNNYEFYTDGSLFNRGQQETTMGAAWIQTKGPNPGNEFLTGSKTGHHQPELRSQQ